MGGREAIEKLLVVAPDAKAVISSGYSSDPVMSDFSQHGFKGVVTKPYKAVELSKILHKVIVGTGD
jgi:DNA-binding NarL/FixJ family response regulator